MTELVILHTNDLHAHFQNWNAQVSWIRHRKATLEAEGKTVWVFDLGDFADRVHPLMEATDCLVTTPMLQEMGVDAVTLGNNEGLANSPVQIEAMYSEADFDVLCANMKRLETEELLLPLKRYIIREVDGKRIGLFGLTAPFPHCYEPNGLLVEPYERTVPSILDDLRGRVDAVVCLSHLGIHDDEAMAAQFPEVTVILGAHTHHVFLEGRHVGQSLLTGGGKHGHYVGELTLSLGTSGVHVLQERLIDLDEWHTSTDTAVESQLMDEGRLALASQVITELNRELSERELTEMSLEAMCRAAHCTVAFSYTGLFLKPLGPGVVTQLDLHECLPHPIHLNRCRMRREDFQELLASMEAQREHLATLPIIGRGFRGRIFGELYQTQVHADSDWVTFVCPDHMRFVEYFPMIRDKGENDILYPELLRHVVADHLREEELHERY